MEIILLLLGEKQDDSEQHEYFHWYYSHHHILSSNKHTAVQQGRRLVKDSTHFSSGVSHLYIKKNRTRHLDASDPLPLNTNLIITLKNQNT